MTAETLARIQFAFTVGYHFIYVPMSIGIALMVVIAEGRYYRSRLEADKAASNFWIKLFTTTFAVGVATGLTMEFAFGTNWANYSRFVGDIFGSPLAAEGIFAFFLESTFLGVLLFGRKRVGRGMYYASTWLVFLGANLSALWILIANSWQQTPAGYKVVDGKAVMTSFWAVVANPSTAPRLVHTLAATWIAGAFAVAGISAWYLLKRRHVAFARRHLLTALIIGLVISGLMPLIGDWQATEVATHQPVKLAAFEGIGRTTEDAPMTIIGWWSPSRNEAVGLRIPGLLSFLAFGSFSDEVKGLDSVPPADRPPVQPVFLSYHFMVMFSGYFVLLMLVSLVFYLWKRRIESMRWLLWLLVISIPFPIVASELGWMATEIGRQPWIVQGLLRTSDGVSPVVSAGEVVATLAIFAVVYALLFFAWLRIFTRLIARGPEEIAAAEPAAATEPVEGPGPVTPAAT
jgi:cytochrome d ubiquinol oxidase subunit I